MITRAQAYAQQAFERVSAVAASDAGRKKRYGSLCHRVAPLVRRNGLVQVVAFFAVRANEARDGGDKGWEYKRLLEDLTTAFGENFVRTTRGEAGGLLDYLRLTTEVLAYATWLARYADSVLGVRRGEEDDRG
jgi:CRISPR type III-B/RAMP module-associated protein Cmr5